MQLIKQHERLGVFLFYFGISIHILLMVIGYGEWNLPFHSRFMQIAFVLFSIKIVLTYYSKTEWLVMIPLGVLGIVSYYYTGDEYVISVLAMILAAKNVDMYGICKWILYVSFATTVMTAILSLFGIGGAAMDIRDYGRGGEEVRWCLGFGHANNFHGTVLYLVLLLVFVYFVKLKWQHYLALTIVNIVIFDLTVSRSGLIATQLVITAGLILKYRTKISGYCWFYLLGVLELVGIVMISIASAVIPFEQYQILADADKLLTGRLQLVYRYADISRWKILSTGVITDMVDNGWITIFFSYGYIIGSLFIIFHIFLLYKSWKEQNGVLLVMIMTSMFYTFMESSYTMNSAYLLCNVSYITAMILISGKVERRGFIDNGREEIEWNCNSNISV